MTLQKAMRVRSELKKAAESLQTMLQNVSYSLEWKDEQPSMEEVEAKREEKMYALNGMSFREAADKLFAISDICAELNTKIEDVNREGHNLLYKEACIKTKLQFVDNCLKRERNISAKTENYEYVLDEQIHNKVVMQEKEKYCYPIVSDTTFGMSLTELRKKLNSELEDIRDELAVFNATAKVDFELPTDLI